MSKYGRGAALREIGKGIRDIGGIVSTAWQERQNREQEEKQWDAGQPLRELQLQKLTQDVEGEKAKTEEKKRYSEANKKFNRIMYEIEQDEILQKLFQDDIEKGLLEEKKRKVAATRRFISEEGGTPEIYKELQSMQQGQDSGTRYGKSSVGAALEFTRSPEGQKMLADVKSNIAQLKAQGLYSEHLLESIGNQASIDVRQANNTLSGLLAATEKTVRTLKESIPAKVETAERVTAAGTESKIVTEAGLAEVSGKTAGTIAGGKEKGKREAGITLPAGETGRLGEFNASFAQLKTLLSGIENPDAPQGPISQLRKKNPYDWQAQAKQQLVASTKQLVGKALEGGVLRAEDEKKYEKILPKLGDTYETAIQKTKNLNTMIGNAYKARLDAFENAGYFVDKFREEQEPDELDNLLFGE